MRNVLNNNPITKQKLSLFSSEGKKLLRKYIKLCSSWR